MGLVVCIIFMCVEEERNNKEVSKKEKKVKKKYNSGEIVDLYAVSASLD